MNTTNPTPPRRRSETAGSNVALETVTTRMICARARRRLGPIDVEEVVDEVLSQIRQALAKDERVVLRGFGTLYMTNRHQANRHPVTGEKLDAWVRVVRFRASQLLNRYISDVSQ